MNEGEFVEVHFNEYCSRCKYKDVKEPNDPCEECLSNPTNLGTHRPVKYEPKKKEG